MTSRVAYRACQAAGWAAWTIANVGFFALSSVGVTSRSIVWAIVNSVLGFLISHGYRHVIRARRWSTLSLARLAPRLLAGTVVQAAILDASVVGVEWLTRSPASPRLTFDFALVLLFNFSVVFLTWSLLYFGLHWLARGRRAEQAELRYLKAQLNPHFLFNSLNGIRGLVAENPARAQEAIMRLAKLLRVALGSATVDTVPLERELEVVDDYLALEAVRFDDRLAVTLDIAPEALAVPVPAMLVQTLVENGVKHGIARRTDGGRIAVTARVRDAILELSVANTAAADPGRADGDGIGLANATERLQLLFGARATLRLDRSSAERTVAEVKIPIR